MPFFAQIALRGSGPTMSRARLGGAREGGSEHHTMRMTTTNQRITGTISKKITALAAVTTGLVLLGAGCAPPAPSSSASGSAANAAATWTSAQAAGGMDAHE